jgi:hypothetical protein
VVDKDGNPPEHPNQRFYDKSSGRLVQKGLAQVVRMWPTPKCQNANSPAIHGQGGMDLQTAVKLYPTPQAGATTASPGREWSENGRVQSKDGKHDFGMNLATYVKCSPDAPPESSGQLNPVFVEWLMGFPPGWTDLEH